VSEATASAGVIERWPSGDRASRGVRLHLCLGRTAALLRGSGEPNLAAEEGQAAAEPPRGRFSGRNGPNSRSAQAGQ